MYNEIFYTSLMERGGQSKAVRERENVETLSGFLHSYVLVCVCLRTLMMPSFSDARHCSCTISDVNIRYSCKIKCNSTCDVYVRRY